MQFLNILCKLAQCPYFHKNVISISSLDVTLCLQCFDAVGWAAGRASNL